VTVLMSVHNDRRYLAESVGSILDQSFDDFEFLIIDDGSTDGSSDVLRCIGDSRVRLITNRQNLGLTRSLNIGLDRARGKYVVRMDADDIAEAMRLEWQVDAMERQSDLGVLGTGRLLIDDAGATVNVARPVHGRTGVLWKMLLGNAFAHPTVMLRREVLERHQLRYDDRFITAQDYELWVRLLQHAAGDNLAEPLVRYRLRQGISQTRKADQLANHDRIAFQAIRAIVPDFHISPAEVTQLRARFGGFSVRDAGMDPADPKWVERYEALRRVFERRYAGMHDSGAIAA
jgi:glycosyltransferase involved in cell wall biosynthesis